MQDNDESITTADETDTARRAAWTREMLRKAEDLHAELLRQWPDWPNECESDDEC